MKIVPEADDATWIVSLNGLLHHSQRGMGVIGRKHLRRAGGIGRAFLEVQVCKGQQPLARPPERTLMISKDIRASEQK
jgi:hypothetical protein